MVEEFKYYEKDELLPYVGKEVQYQPWSQIPTDVRVGVLEQDKKGLWLPFCGGVSAMTVKIKL
jgi:hypothetical protein